MPSGGADNLCMARARWIVIAVVAVLGLAACTPPVTGDDTAKVSTQDEARDVPGDGTPGTTAPPTTAPGAPPTTAPPTTTPTTVAPATAPPTTAPPATAPPATTPPTAAPSTTTTQPAPTTTTAPPAPSTTTTAPTPAGVPGSSVGFAQAYSPLWQPAADLARDFDAIAATGAKWVRFDFMWGVVQSNGRDSWDWSTIDRGVNAAKARGLKVLATLAYTPPWARPAGATSDKWAPTNPDDFVRFARAAVARYAPQGVHAYQIWNEPNTGFWSPKPDPVAYTELLRRSYPAIHEVDPQATVVVGGLAAVGPTLDWEAAGGAELSAYRFLTRMYAAGAAGYFDALGQHPYGIPGGPREPGTWNAFGQTPALHDLMASKGDGAKKIWGTEAGYYTGTGPHGVNEAKQAEYISDYVTLWTQRSYTGPIFIYSLRDRSTDASASEDNFGLLKVNFTPKQSYTTLSNVVAGP